MAFYHGGVFMLVLDIRGDGAYADAHRTDKHKGIVVSPVCRDGIATHSDGGGEMLFQAGGDSDACLADLYDCYLLHFRISIG